MITITNHQSQTGRPSTSRILLWSASSAVVLLILTCGLMVQFPGLADYARPRLRFADFSVENVHQQWGDPKKNLSVDGHFLSVGGARFDSGIGTHAPSLLLLRPKGTFRTLSGLCGIDDEADIRGSVVFQIRADAKTLFDSGLRRGGMPALQFVVDLAPLSAVELITEDGGDGNTLDHADWLALKLSR